MQICILFTRLPSWSNMNYAKVKIEKHQQHFPDILTCSASLPNSYHHPHQNSIINPLRIQCSKKFPFHLLLLAVMFLTCRLLQMS